MATLFMRPFGNAEIASKRGYLMTKWATLSTWLLNSSTEATFWWSLTCDRSICTPFAYPGSSICLLLPRNLSHQFSNHVFSKSLTIQRIYCYRPWTSKQLHIWWFLLPNIMHAHMHSLKHHPLWRFAFARVLHNCLRKGPQHCSRTLLGGAFIACTGPSKTGPSLLFLSHHRMHPMRPQVHAWQQIALQ